ncbi:MAG TPA: hypothetical protein VMB05_07225 [Solirubrobacteraceae bacterium]|nr:hypothetical protein [Solirubrobacteraceae bacterium]
MVHLTGARALDPLEQVALVARDRRVLLLRVHRHRLRIEDLEDCYSQAVLELIASVKAGGVFADRLHLARALELRFVSRVRDRRRALGGRSPMQAALERANPLGGEAEGVVDRDLAVDAQVIVRDELRRLGEVAQLLTHDQRMVLRSQVEGERCAELCRRQGWSREKYRKVAQRARAQLRMLIDRAEGDVPFGPSASEEIAGLTYAHVHPHT